MRPAGTAAFLFLLFGPLLDLPKNLAKEFSVFITVTCLKPVPLLRQGAYCCRGRRHKEPKPTRRRGSCVAAPEKGKLLVRVGQRGASGGMQGGPRRGRSPITGPALPHAAQAAQTTEKKGRRARRAHKLSFKGQALFSSKRPRPYRTTPPAAQAAKTKGKRKPPCPQGTTPTSQRTGPALFS